MSIGADTFIVNNGASAEDLQRLPRVACWPELAREALHGLPGRIVNAIDPYTEADPVAILGHLLVGLGNVIGPGPHLPVEHDEHPARLNIVFVGRSSKGRKGLAQSTAKHLLAQIDEPWARDRIRPGLSTGEGLIFHVRDAREEQQAIREKGRIVGYETVVVDAGESDKRLMIVESEFATVLKRMARDGNTLSTIIREAWDAGNLSTLTKNSPLRATGAHVSIISHGTQEEIRRYLTDTERANGFANRFLWLLVQRSKVLPDGATVPDSVLTPLVDELRQVVTFSRTVTRMSRDDAAREIWREVYPSLSEGEPGLIGGVISRAEAQVVRLSVLYAVCDRSAEIRAPHLQAALALWDYAEASARRIFGGRIGMPLADAILDAMNARERSMDLTDISDLLGRHRTAEEIQEALGYLEKMGKARRSQRVTAGRPATVWEAV
jgi:hypothetical protein